MHLVYLRITNDSLITNKWIFLVVDCLPFITWSNFAINSSTILSIMSEEHVGWGNFNRLAPQNFFMPCDKVLHKIPRNFLSFWKTIVFSHYFCFLANESDTSLRAYFKKIASNPSSSLLDNKHSDNGFLKLDTLWKQSFS